MYRAVLYRYRYSYYDSLTKTLKLTHEPRTNLHEIQGYLVIPLPCGGAACSTKLKYDSMMVGQKHMGISC